ncbi:unknown [Prevotella sp. CAG:891]|nr:unknown [Prevotella sp. CAG:891]
MFSFTKIFCIFKIESVYLWNETQHCMVSIYILPLQQRKYTKGNSVF